MNFDEIVDMIVKSCRNDFLRGVSYDGLASVIIVCATKIYLELNKKDGGNK